MGRFAFMVKERRKDVADAEAAFGVSVDDCRWRKIGDRGGVRSVGVGGILRDFESKYGNTQD